MFFAEIKIHFTFHRERVEEKSRIESIIVPLPCTVNKLPRYKSSHIYVWTRMGRRSMLDIFLKDSKGTLIQQQRYSDELSKEYLYTVYCAEASMDTSNNIKNNWLNFNGSFENILYFWSFQSSNVTTMRKYLNIIILHALECQVPPYKWSDHEWQALWNDQPVLLWITDGFQWRSRKVGYI